MNKWGTWITASTLATAWLVLVLGLWLMPAARAAAPAPTPAPWPADAADQARLPAAWQQALEQRIKDGTELPPNARLEVQVGAPSPQLRLAPCAAAEPVLPNTPRRWGTGRIGLRCTAGARWNLYLPVTVKVFAPAVVLTQPLPAGTELSAAHLKLAEADIAAAPSPTFEQSEALIGRRLAIGLAAGAEVRLADLRARQWFAAGDPVTLVAVGSGFAVEGEGQAMSPGLEGQPVRVRTPSGRIVMGTPSGERRVEVPL